MTTQINPELNPISFFMTEQSRLRRAYIAKQMKPSAYFPAMFALLNSEVATRVDEMHRRMLRSDYNQDAAKAERIFGAEKVAEVAAQHNFPTRV